MLFDRIVLGYDYSQLQNQRKNHRAMKKGKVTEKSRTKAAPSNFVFPKDKRYPIPDETAARNALVLSHGKPEESKVRAAVYQKFPNLKNPEQASELPVDERFRLKPVSIRLTESDEGIHVPNRIQLFRTGRFKKWDEDSGRWIEFEITRELLSEMVQNFENKVRGIDLALDFAHKSDEEAAGWFKKLLLEESAGECELWAEVDWTPDGHAAVKGKKFRYISPDFAFAWTDNETGKKYGATLFGAGLTNRPVIKNMAPTVELTEVHEMAKKIEKKASETQVKKISELSKEELEVRLAEETDEDKKEFIQLKLDEMSAEKEEEGEGEGEKKEMSFEELKEAHAKVCAELADLKKAQATMLAETAKKEKEAKFTVLCNEGKAVPAQKDAYMADDMVKFAELAQPTKFKAVGTEGDPVNKDGSAQDEVLKLAEEAVKAGKVKSRPDGISLVLSENKELNARYQKEMEGDAAEA